MPVSSFIIVAIVFFAVTAIVIGSVLGWYYTRKDDSVGDTSVPPVVNPVTPTTNYPNTLRSIGYFKQSGTSDPISVGDGAATTVTKNSHTYTSLLNGYGRMGWSRDGTVMVEVMNRFGNTTVVVTDSETNANTTVTCNHAIMTYQVNTKSETLQYIPAYQAFTDLTTNPLPVVPSVVGVDGTWGNFSRTSVAVSDTGQYFSVTYMDPSKYGSVYIYKQQLSGDGTYVIDTGESAEEEKASLPAGTTSVERKFGKNVQWISDSVVVVSSDYPSGPSPASSGTVRFFRANSNPGPLSYSFDEYLTQVIATGDGTNSFGDTFACDSNAYTLLVSDGVEGNMFVYSREPTDTGFALKQKLQIDGAPTEITMSEPPLIAAVGVEGKDVVHVFVRPSTSDNFKLTQSISVPTVAAADFGSLRRFGHTAKLSIDGRMLVVGCNTSGDDRLMSGLYLYRWDQTMKYFHTDTPAQYIGRRSGASTYVSLNSRMPTAKILAGDPASANVDVYTQIDN